jgi:hypothetical protein
MMCLYTIDGVEHLIQYSGEALDDLLDAVEKQYGERGVLTVTRDSPELRRRPNSRMVEFLGVHSGK